MRRAVWTNYGRWVLGTAALVGLSGCKGFFTNPNNGGGGGGGATGSNIVYVANGATQSISGWVIGTGALTAVGGLPGPLGFTPTAMTVSRANDYVWISDGVQGIYAYTIGSDGALNKVGAGAAAVAANGELSMDVSPDGQWLVGLDPLTQTVDTFQIDSSSGGLTLVGQSIYTTTNGIPVPKMVRFAPSGGFLFLALGTAGVEEFPFNTSSGTTAYAGVSILPGSATTSDNAVLVNAASSIVYVARSGTNQVLAFGIDGSGNLTPVAGSPFAAGAAPYDLAISGSNLYVANRSDGTVGGYAIGTTGALTAVTGSPFAAGTAPQSLAVDSSGTYLFAAGNGGAPDLSMWSFSSGALTPVTTETPAANDGAILVATTH